MSTHTNESKTSISSSSSDSSDDGERPYDPIADALDALIDSVADYDDPAELWDHVRQWLRTRDLAETRAAVEYKGEFDTTALHVACRNHPPVDVVEVMLRAAPDMIFWADSFGWLPVRFPRGGGGVDGPVQSMILRRVLGGCFPFHAPCILPYILISARRSP